MITLLLLKIILTVGITAITIWLIKQGFKSFEPRKCEHFEKELIHVDYQEGYYKFRCIDCGEVVYKDMD